MSGTPRPIGRRRAVLGCAALAGAALGLAAGQRTARADPADGIVGAWLVRWSGQTRQHVRTWAFLPGGVLITFDAPVDTTSAVDDHHEELDHGGSGVEQWLESGANEYAYTYIEVEYDGQANAIATEKFIGMVRRDPIRYTLQGSFRMVETALDGRVIATRGATPTEGTRIGVEP